jgi:hypothetical protein
MINRKPFFEASTSEDFIASLMTLSNLQISVKKDYDNLHIHIADFKKTNIAFLGNPFVKFQTELFELTYLLKMHILNCRVYHDLLFEDIEIDDNLILQLNSLLITTKNLCERYDDIIERLRVTPWPRRLIIIS